MTCGIDILVVEKKSGDSVLAEGPVIIEGGLEIDVAVHGLVPAIAKLAATGICTGDSPLVIGEYIIVPETCLSVLRS